MATAGMLASAAGHILGQQCRHVNVGISCEEFLFVIEGLVVRIALTCTISRGASPMILS
jgi:hypothetical protein